MIRFLASIAVVMSLAFCAHGGAGGPAGESDRPAPFVRLVLETGARHGLSGLATDSEGRLWAVPERQQVLLPLSVGENEARIAGHPIPIEGIPARHDTESLAWAGPGRFALGTEAGRTGGAGDSILFGRIDEGRARVTRTVRVPYRRAGLATVRNRGIEGLCHAAGRLVAAVEQEVTRDGARYTPLFVGAPPGAARPGWSLHWVRLTTRSGRLSSVACRPAKGGIEVLAIERHYTVSRLLRFVLARDDPASRIEPELVFDLAPWFAGLAPNFEGVGWLADGRIVLLSDNHYGGVTGPTELLLLPAPDREQAAGR